MQKINNVSYSIPHGAHCLSHEFTGSTKLALEKQISPLSLIITLCMCSVQVWLLARPIKWNRPNVTVWLVFQNPVTIMLSALVASQHMFV